MEPDAIEFPFARQLVRIRSTRLTLKTNLTTVEDRYFVTSLTPQEADPSRLKKIIRSHWSIENKNHWRRDALWNEDRIRTSNPNIAKSLALIRNCCLGLMIQADYHNFAQAICSFRNNPNLALKLILKNL